MIKEVDSLNNNPFSRRIEYILDNIVVGYLEYSLIYDRIEIDNLLVDDKYRNQGIGTKLMAYLVSLAINSMVVNMYKKFGFREVALRNLYYGNEDGILMEKQVM